MKEERIPFHGYDQFRTPGDEQAVREFQEATVFTVHGQVVDGVGHAHVPQVSPTPVRLGVVQAVPSRALATTEDPRVSREVRHFVPVS